MTALGNNPVRTRLQEIQSGISLDVFIQDQHTQILRLAFLKELGSFTLATNTVIDTYTITVNSGHSIAIGQTIELAEVDYVEQFQVLNVVGDVITLDILMDREFTTSGCVGINGTRNMNVDGSVTAQHFRVTTENLDPDVAWDVTMLSFTFQDKVAMDDGLFGSVPALTRGTVLRKLDGKITNIANAKTNGELSLMGDTEYASKAPSGVYAFRGKVRFAGQHNAGVTIRLGGTERLEIVVQDDLTALEAMLVALNGHIVD